MKSWVVYALHSIAGRFVTLQMLDINSHQPQQQGQQSGTMGTVLLATPQGPRILQPWIAQDQVVELCTAPL